MKRDVNDSTVTLRVAGELDLRHAPGLAVAAANEIRCGHDLIIDLTAVTFMDSTALAMLLNASRRATRAGLGFAVVCPSGPAYRSIEIARLLETLTVCETRDGAMGRLHRFDATRIPPGRPPLVVIRGDNSSA